MVSSYIGDCAPVGKGDCITWSVLLPLDPETEGLGEGGRVGGRDRLPPDMECLGDDGRVVGRDRLGEMISTSAKMVWVT